MQQKSTALVTGSSSGIGFETSLSLARAGFYTYATMRNLDKSSKIIEITQQDNLPLEVLRLDVTDDKSVKDAIDTIAVKQKRIDVVVNNAGYGSTGAVEDFSIDEIKAQFETNFFGAIRVIQHVLPLMRERRSGIIVNISSIGGRIAFPFSPSYASTKFALEGLSEALQYEVEQFGIKVMLVEPGIIKTNFFDNILKAKRAADPASPYSELLQRRINRVKTMFENGTAPEEVAKVILKAITSITPDLRYLVGSDANSLIEKRKNVPERKFLEFMSQNILGSGNRMY
ncbi:MAG TPA: SDR family oxidoreductase [Candidatus Bathyarchaeia archaeon]|nr:SDR family oxidoreductase [Candidatus Bathyarchaeia archaeon]